MIKIQLLGYAGIEHCAKASRLSHRSECDNGLRDKALLKKLIHAGDEHAKSLRGAVAWLEINAPRYWWQEFATYRVGCEQLGSESTMHDHPELYGEALQAYKANLPEGTMQKRIFMVSLQTLRRIYRQRRHHRLPEWLTFCGFLEEQEFSEYVTLP